MHRWNWKPILFLGPVILTLSPVTGHELQAQEWHPGLKELWEDSNTWPVITPEHLDVDPEKFIGLRALYQVEEGLRNDPSVQDAIFQFERAARNGDSVILASFSTLGNISEPASAPGWWSGVVEPRSLTMLDWNSASPGKWGLFVNRPAETGTMKWSLGIDQDEWSDPELEEGHGPVFHLSLWGHILAGMNLEEGMKFQLAALRGPAVAHIEHYVAGKTTFEDTSGRQHEVWAVENPAGRSGWIATYYVSDQAPFYYGMESKHVESGEVSRRWRLKSFHRLDR